MSLLLATALLAGAAPPEPSAPPITLQFEYFRTRYFQQRARSLHCGASDLDRELDAIVQRLAERYGKNAFPDKNGPDANPGDCGIILVGYRGHVASFRQQAEAALNASAQAPAPGK